MSYITYSTCDFITLIMIAKCRLCGRQEGINDRDRAFEKNNIPVIAYPFFTIFTSKFWRATFKYLILRQTISRNFRTKSIFKSCQYKIYFLTYYNSENQPPCATPKQRFII
jgi:hypothetical protein